MDSTENQTNKAEFDLIDLATLLVQSWKIIGLWAILAAVIAVSYALYLPNIYKSEVILAPADREGSGASAGQLGGIASLAGISIGGGASNSDSGLAVEILKSRQFFGAYLYNDILVELFAATGWISSEDRLSIDPTIYDRSNKEWTRETTPPFKPKPSVQEAYDLFRSKHFASSVELDTGLHLISVRHISPSVAQRWVSIIVKAINREMQRRAIEKAESSIRHLTDIRKTNSVTNVNNILSTLIEDQVKQKMLAGATNNYVFEIVEPPVVPEQRDSPRRSVIAVGGTMLGVVLGILFVIGRAALGSKPE